MFHAHVSIIAFTVGQQNQIFLVTIDISYLLKRLLSVAILISLIVWDFLRSESFCVVQQITYLQRLEHSIQTTLMSNHRRLAIIGLHDFSNDVLNTELNSRRFLILRESRLKDIRHCKNDLKSIRQSVRRMKFCLRIHGI